MSGLTNDASLVDRREELVCQVNVNEYYGSGKEIVMLMGDGYECLKTTLNKQTDGWTDGLTDGQVLTDR